MYLLRFLDKIYAVGDGSQQTNSSANAKSPMSLFRLVHLQHMQ